MTTISPAVDVDDITHLDFAPPCHVETCEQEAAWLAVYRRTPPCCPATFLVCGAHVDGIRDAIRRDLILVCPHQTIGPIRDHLARLQPL